MRRALLASLLALIVLPATASAQILDPETLLEGPVAERAPARIARGGELDFAVRSPTAPGSITIRISGTSQTDDLGRLHGPDGSWVDNAATPGVQPDLHEWHADAGFLARRRPGSYWWQVIVNPDGADPAQQPTVGAVERFEVLQPAANRRRHRLHPGYGRQGAGSFYLSNAAFPAGVSGSRFRALARRTAARWGLKARRWTGVRAGRRDGYNIAGFSSSVPREALAMQVDYVVGSRRNVVERDLALRPDLAWQAGTRLSGAGPVRPRVGTGARAVAFRRQQAPPAALRELPADRRPGRRRVVARPERPLGVRLRRGHGEREPARPEARRRCDRAPDDPRRLARARRRPASRAPGARPPRCARRSPRR